MMTTKTELPLMCYIFSETTGTINLIIKGEKGNRESAYNETITDRDARIEFVNNYNAEKGISKAIETAMHVGSFLGFDHPDADPGKYNEEGEYITEELPYWQRY